MSIKLVALFPSHLDLNGDQANLKVAAKRLTWFGHEVEIVAVESRDLIPEDAALIFLGHGSMAAWADLESELTGIIPKLQTLISSGSAFMAVATGHEFAIKNGLITGQIKSVDRISKFEITELEGQEILGYLNSATDAPVIQKSGLVLGTQLHGPVFSKNPQLVDSYLAEILATRGVILANKNILNKNLDLVNSIVDQVWELERDLASE